MADSVYCTRADIANVLRGGSLPNPARLVAEVVPATDLLVLDGHSFELGIELVFRAEMGGSMPAPLEAGTTYYAIPTSDSTFRVAATPGGAAINLTTTGDHVLVTSPLPWAAAIEWASAIVDENLGAHRTQLAPPYPETVVSGAATLAAWRLLSFSGNERKSMTEVVAETQKMLERWAKGQPVRGPNVPASANLAISATVTGGVDPRRYTPPDGGIP
jgi:hypothetical protein